MSAFPKRLKRFLVAALELILVFGAAALVLFFCLGWIKIGWPEVNRTAPAHAETEPEATQLGPVSFEDGENPAWRDLDRPVDDTVAGLFDPTLLSGEAVSFPTVTEAEGNGLTRGDPADAYEPGKSALARLEMPEMPEDYSLRSRQTTRKVVTDPAGDTERFAEERTVIEAVPAVEPYMGYLLLDPDGSGSRILCSADGTPLCTYDDGKYALLWQRDKAGHPLFARTGDGATYYFILSEDGTTFLQSDYDPVTDYRGFTFDYPASIGQSEGNILQVASDGDGLLRYDVVRKDGLVLGQLTDDRFEAAFPFSGNRGAVAELVEGRTEYYFLDENGERAFETHRSYFNANSWYVDENLLLPLTDGMESIGFYYYDHGMTRVRRQICDHYQLHSLKLVRVVTDTSELYDVNGNRFQLPPGCLLEGYSEGFLLLRDEGTGLLGLMGVDGTWIAQPVYADATPVIGGLATLTLADGRVGMIDTTGGIVLPFAYEHITSVSSGVVAAYGENGWTVFRLMMREDRS